MFGQQTGRQTISHRKNANIPRVQSALNFFLNIILIRFQTFELSHPFKGPAFNICIVTSSCILISTYDHILGLFSNIYVS